MKLSIITPTLNSEKTISYSLNSVFNQTYKKFEHIIVDGGSTDNTLKILKDHKVNKKIIIKKKSSIYEAINIGIKNSNGEFIIILNSDDIFQSNLILDKIVKYIKQYDEKIFFGNIVYFNNDNFKKIVRFYSAEKFKPWMMYFGLMPPHTGSIIHKDVYKKFTYDKKFRIAGDFEFFLRILLKKKINYKVLNFCITRMKTGGISGRDINSHILSSKEINDSFKRNKIKNNIIFIYLRFIAKLHQIFLFNQKKINKSFNFFQKNIYKKYKFYDFKIIDNINKLDFNKNFTLSALNLAFLGNYAEKKILIYKELVNWPDGIFSKLISSKLRKIPGRDILRKLVLPKEIKKISVLGTLSPLGKNFLKKKFKKKINHISLPYGNIDEIIKDFKFKTSKDELILITLPTPKQEQLAHHLKKNNKFFKIICIGGSINIVTGEEKEVPKILYKLEFIWRLRYDTGRRLLRLLHTFYAYIKFNIFEKKIYNLNAKIL